jgi:hypothetical protein
MQERLVACPVLLELLRTESEASAGMESYYALAQRKRLGVPVPSR